MRNFLFVTTLFIISAITAQTGTTPATTAGTSTAVIWNPIVEMNGILFPSYVYATATRAKRASDASDYFGDTEGQIGLDLTSPVPNVKFKVTIDAPELMYQSSFEGVLITANSKYEVFPEIKYKFDELIKIKQPKVVTLSYRLFINDIQVGDKTKIISVKSINECLIGYTDRAGNYKKQAWMCSAFVNENSPQIQDDILPGVMKTGIIENIIGYQSYSEKNTAVGTTDVFMQVLAVWTYLQERGVTYSNITGSGGDAKLTYQYIRFLEDAMKSNQANCVDGSALFASILYKMGIDPILVIIPGHCFLGFHDRPKINSKGEEIEDRPMYFLETTMIGSRNITTNDVSQIVIDFFKQAVPPNAYSQHKYAVESFMAALTKGINEYKQNEALFADPRQVCLKADINEARKEGVIPIPSK